MPERIVCSCGTVWHPVPSIRKARRGDRGPDALMSVDSSATEHQYLWDCTCGQRLFLVTPRTYLVTCQHGAGTTGMCAVAAIRKNPPSDLYVNARYGGACPCCGHQGTHVVRLDRQGPLPRCLT